MRIAVPYSQGHIFGHFGRARQFAIFEIDGKSVVSSSLLAAGGQRCAALAGLLKSKGVDVLLCGGISAAESAALSGCGIEYVANVQGSARHAVEEYITGTLLDNPVKYSGHYDYEKR